MGALPTSHAELLDRRWWRVRVERRLDASPEAIWRWIGDLDTWVEWYRPLSRFEPIAGDGGVGTLFAEHESWWRSTVELTEVRPGRSLDLATRSINLPGLLRGLHRRIELRPEGASTSVVLTGGFRFGTLGWLFASYAFPQMHASLWLEYRSALCGLEDAVSHGAP